MKRILIKKAIVWFCLSLFVCFFCQTHAELLPKASSYHFYQLISKQGNNIPCDPCDDPCNPALTCEGIKQINLRISHNVCAHHLTTESKLDLIDSKVDELFSFITSEHEITRATIITRIAQLHVTMESKLDLIDSKVEELFPHITSEHDITRETIITRIAELHVTMESKLDLIDSKVEEIIDTVEMEHETTRETIITRIAELHVTMESKLDLIDSKVEEIIPVVIFEHEITRETIIERIAELHVTMESKLDLIDNKVEEIIYTVETEHDITRETIITRISELHVTMESKLDLIDSKISYILEQGTGGDGGTCDCPTPIDDEYISTKGNTIDTPGSYVLCVDIDGEFTITKSDVTFDLNGFTVNSSANGITVNDSLTNVTIKNGYIVGTGQTNLGISIKLGCKCIKMKNICIKDFTFGISFNGTSGAIEACLVKNCIINECSVGIFAVQLRKGTFENVEATECENSFILRACSHNYFNSCKAKKALEGFANLETGNNNTFANCVAKNIVTVGFRIESNETKLIGCVIGDINSDSSAWGILITGASGTKIVNCMIKKLSGTSSCGINLNGASTVIENNNIGIIEGDNSEGILLTETSNNNMIANNTIYDVDGRGVVIVEGAKNNIVYNNLISNILPKSNGTTIMGSAIFADEDDNCISKNISYNNDVTPIVGNAPSFWDPNTVAPMQNAAQRFLTNEDYFNTWYN